MFVHASQSNIYFKYFISSIVSSVRCASIFVLFVSLRAHDEMKSKECVTLACWFPVRPLLNLHAVPGAADEVLLLERGVSWDVKGIPVLRQGDLRAVFGLLVDLEHHPALIQVDVLKKPEQDKRNKILR